MKSMKGFIITLSVILIIGIASILFVIRITGRIDDMDRAIALRWILTQLPNIFRDIIYMVLLVVAVLVSIYFSVRRFYKMIPLWADSEKIKG